MIEKAIKAIVVGVVLWLVYLALEMLTIAIHAPAIILVIILVIIILVFCAYLLKLFGIILE